MAPQPRFGPRTLGGLEGFSYRGVDLDERAIAFARDHVPRAVTQEGVTVMRTDRGFRTDTASVEFLVGDALDHLEAAADVDLVLAQAFLDLVPIERAIEAIEAALAPGGVAYLPITFDAETLFAPDHPEDAAVQRSYHDAIDELRDGTAVRADTS